MASAETNTSEQSSSVGSALFQNIENSEMSNGARPSAACITEIDISAPARALGVLRWSDYLLVVGCGYSALWMLFDLVTSPINSEWAKIVLEVPVVGVLAFAAFTGWRHLGVIDPRVWRSYLYVFPLLTAFALLMTYAVATTWMSRSKPLEDIESMLAMSGSLWFLGIAIPGFISLLVLRRVRITAVGKRLDDLLNDLTCQSGHSALNLTEIKRIDIHRGLAFIILGAALLLIGMFLPSPAERTIDDRFAGSLAQLSQWLTIVAFFSIIRARRYFQVSADHLLAVDKRPPILFLRSFSDENPLTGIYRAIVDFSLETRLANHFYRFGPFIAVGSPKELLPLPGAARVILPDSEWQARVLSWIKEANLIVMYLGTTEWVNWELRKIVEQGRATSRDYS
ncbi:MAG: hypothetical protein OJF50_002881 [Nitrospira sp.]|jgi:hypothetical protein|nr:hypothetical protein [Nitrospira sp.]